MQGDNTPPELVVPDNQGDQETEDTGEDDYVPVVDQDVNESDKCVSVSGKGTLETGKCENDVVEYEDSVCWFVSAWRTPMTLAAGGIVENSRIQSVWRKRFLQKKLSPLMMMMLMMMLMMMMMMTV